MNILISGIGGPTPRSIAIRLRNLYPDATIVGIDSSARAIGFYLNGLLDHRVVVPRAKDPGYWNEIKRIISDYKIDLAFIQPEAEVIEWGEYYRNSGTYPVPVLIPATELSVNLVNKALMADLLSGTEYIPKTIRITQAAPRFEEIDSQVGFPCWIRASVGSGGLGSLKINRKEDLEAWLFIHKDIDEFTVSEFLPGRHLANQMLYINGKCVKNAGLECVEYVMADVAPSKVTGNTSFGRLLNDNSLLEFCEECIEYISAKLNVVPHGVFSFDLKEDANGKLKVTEINVRHMAYTGIMARAGCDLINDTVLYLQDKADDIKEARFYNFKEDYIFLRDVDIEPVLMRESELPIA